LIQSSDQFIMLVKIFFEIKAKVGIVSVILI